MAAPPLELARLSPSQPGPTLPVGAIRPMYFVALRTLGVPAIREFWQAHPLTWGGRTVSEAELYRSMWMHQGEISAFYCEGVMNDFEAYIHRHGVTVKSEVIESMHRLNQWGIWRSEHVLAWTKEFLPRLYRESNPRLTLIHILNEWSMGAFPGSWCEVNRVDSDEEWTEVVAQWAPSKTFDFRFLYPVEVFSAPFHKSIPSYFGMPDYEHVQLLADCRSPEIVLWDAECSTEAGAFHHRGERLGSVVSFLDWARSERLSFDGQDVPDLPVVRIERDYVCPERGRAVLRSGCVYGAPLYLERWRFRSGSTLSQFAKPEHYLDRIIAGLQRENPEEWKPLEAVHEALLAEAEQRLSFEYASDVEALSVNGKVLVTGVPARILLRILKGHAEGQRSFDYRSFKLDAELFPNPKQTGFEVRLKRLQERLARDVPALRLERTREGEFTVQAGCPIELHRKE